jgi:hypothetical protein
MTASISEPTAQLLKMDGHHIQFNVTAALRRQAVEQHRDLIVRVAGYSDYFCDLSPAAGGKSPVPSTRDSEPFWIHGDGSIPALGYSGRGLPFVSGAKGRISRPTR